MIYQIKQTMKGQCLRSRNEKWGVCPIHRNASSSTFFFINISPVKEQYYWQKKTLKKVFGNTSLSNDETWQREIPKDKRAGDNLKIMVSGIGRCHSINEYLTKKYRTCNCNTSHWKNDYPMQKVKQVMKFEVSQWINMQ